MGHPYASRAYAECFDDAEALSVPELGTCLLLRAIPDTALRDASGPYPVCMLAPTGDAEAGIARLAQTGAVSLVLVTDVLSAPGETVLERLFERVVPFKTHYVVELGGLEPRFSKHHRQEIRRARRACETSAIDLSTQIDAWCALYAGLVAHRDIRGVQAFSRGYFEALARLPGLSAFGAYANGELVSAHLWIEHEGLVHSHLAASSARGYETGAAYAVHDHALTHFARSGALLVDLGGSSGTRDAGDGLDFFKRGFATRTEQNLLCGRILDADRYEALCTEFGRSESFFPAYRSG